MNLEKTLHSLTLSEARSLINSIPDDEDSGDVIKFMMSHFKKSVAMNLIQESMHKLAKEGLVELVYDKSGKEIGVRPLVGFREENEA